MYYIWQGNHQLYGHIWCVYTVLANPTYVVVANPSHYQYYTHLCGIPARHLHACVHV